MPEMTLQQAIETARQHHRTGQLQQAEALCRQILAAAPNQPEALYLLGAIALAVGRADVAVDLIRRSLAQQPDSPMALNDLGIALRARGESDQAVAAFRQAVAIHPEIPQSYNNLGSMLQECDRAEEGASVLRQALAINPDFGEAWNNLGNCLQAMNQNEQAIDCYRKALVLLPDFYDAQNNLGNVFRALDRLDEAMIWYRRSIETAPDFAQGWSNMGIALSEMRRFDEAIAAHEHVVKLQPEWPLGHYNLGLTLLQVGQFRRGWEENEWRFKTREIGSLWQDFPQPRWRGEPLNGKRILLHTEQGFGDAIQFIRYLPQVIDRGGRVILQCQPELTRLFAGMPGIYELIERNRPLPGFDVHCALMSLPAVLGTTVKTIPASIPYIHADRDLSAKWRDRITQPGLRVGLVWAGRASHGNDQRRSMPPTELAPLGAIEGVQIFSLQKDRPGNATAALSLWDWTGDLSDFAETAALIDNLDLVISVDTAVAHLAGAMGKTVWLLLPYVSEWRWMLDRNDSPWYPNMRLFRQPKACDWKTPMTAVVDAARREAGNRKTS